MRNDSDSIEKLGSSADRVTDVVAEIVSRTLEVGFKKMQLATEVYCARQQMQAFSAVLEIIDSQRKPLLAQLDKERDKVRIRLLKRQIELLDAKEEEILQQAEGRTEEPKQITVRKEEIEEDEEEEDKPRRREEKQGVRGDRYSNGRSRD